MRTPVTLEATCRLVAPSDATTIMFNYQNFGDSRPKSLEYWSDRSIYKNFCFISVAAAFCIGLVLGVVVPLLYYKNSARSQLNSEHDFAELGTIFLNNSFSVQNKSEIEMYKTVTFVQKNEDREGNPDGDLIKNGIYWGDAVEKLLPEGYRRRKHDLWSEYVENAVAVKLEIGCGRMQNRLVVFQDGLKGCVRYRQNTDQIQGELFSFYLAQILKLPNLAPSTISVVNLENSLWRNLHNEVAAAQWNSNRAIVVTQYISDLDNANIPLIFRPNERHLNKFDVYNMTKNEILEHGELLKILVELAQWSDLIIFDYLTANLDRIVNNLYNYQWNVNIMDAPAHNLAKKSDSNLLLFLDNESGLLHGYRLLKKYEIYHNLLLENLCIFRKQTADIIKDLKHKGNIGFLLREKFERQNSPIVKDVLPTLPDKSVKILNERIKKVFEQIQKCESKFSDPS